VDEKQTERETLSVVRKTHSLPCVPFRIPVKGKGKATSLEAWTGPKGSRRLRLPDFKTIGT
jgi:hypothetical protein